MYGLDAIKDMNRKAGKDAKSSGKQPMVYNGDCNTLRGIPNLGTYRATRHGWKKVETYFVDSSGMGQAGEAALTFAEFCRKAKKGRGYGIVSAGQFQVHIAEFVRSKMCKNRTFSQWLEEVHKLTPADQAKKAPKLIKQLKMEYNEDGFA